MMYIFHNLIRKYSLGQRRKAGLVFVLVVHCLVGWLWFFGALLLVGLF